MTDTARDLIERMAKELDLCHQLLLDDRRETHPLANEARAYIDKPEPDGPAVLDSREPASVTTYPTTTSMSELSPQAQAVWNAHEELLENQCVVTKTQRLETLEKHNWRATTFFSGPVRNGIACPDCGSELMDSNPSMCLTSHPPQWAIHCPGCGYAGTRR